VELPIWHIVISDEQLEILNQNIWSNKFVDAFYKNKGLSEPIKLRYRGGHTRDYRKKSYEIIRKGKTYHLNAEYDDPSMMRNALSFRFFELIGVPSPKTLHISLSLNGDNLGMYLMIEAVDSYFFRRRKIQAQSLFYATNDDANFRLISPETKKRKRSLIDGYRLMSGNDSDRQRLKRFVFRLNKFNDIKLYPYLISILDVDNYLRWLAGAVLTGNYDGFNQNYALYFHRKKRVYRIIPWDYEGTWGRDSYGRLAGNDPVPITGYNLLTEKLMSNKTIRNKYKKMLKAIVTNIFTVERLKPVVDQMYKSIAPSIDQDRTRRRWAAAFHNEPELIMNYIKERREIILNELVKL
jgi:spore coat protein H